MRRKFTGSGLQIWLAHRGGRITSDLLIDEKKRIYIEMGSFLGPKKVYIPGHLYGDNFVDNLIKRLEMPGKGVDKVVDSKGMSVDKSSGP